MNKLLESVLEAHGGVARWNQFNTVTAQVVTGGGFMALKGLLQDSAPRQVRVSMYDEFASLMPLGQPNWRTSFTPARVAIETLEGEVVKERVRPGYAARNARHIARRSALDAMESNRSGEICRRRTAAVELVADVRRTVARHIDAVAACVAPVRLHTTPRVMR